MTHPPLDRLRDLGDLLRRHPRHVILAGIVVGLLSAPGPPWLVALGVALAALAGGSLPVASLAALSVMAGVGWGHERLARDGESFLSRSSGVVLSGRVVVLEPPRERRSGGSSFRGRWLDGPAHGESAVIRMPSAPRTRPPAAGVFPATPPPLMPGTVLRVTGSTAPLAEWESFQRRRGARAAIAVRSVAATGDRRPGVAGLLDRARDRSRTGLSSAVPGEEGALLRGMVLGEDDAVSEATRSDFRDSGLAHLLAVSGQNVMLLAALVIGVATLLGAPLRLRLAAALVLVLLYVPLAGGGPSIQRAGVMGAAGLVAALAGRPAARWYALLLAAAATLAVSPLAAGDPGWQLSFAAVIALLAGAAPVASLLTRWRLPRPLAEVTAITALATLATAPLLAHHFGELSLVSLPANVLAAPAVAPVMWLGMLAAAVAQLDPAFAEPLTLLNVRLVAYIEWVAHVAAAVPNATVPVSSSDPRTLMAVGIVSLAVGAMLHPATRRQAARWRAVRAESGHLRAKTGSVRRRLRSLAPVPVVLATLVVVAVMVSRSRSPEIAAGELVVSFLDVGQGDATLLQTREAAVLVDTGPPDGPILERVADAGVDRLDALVITHAQADHEGEAVAVVSRLRPRLIVNGGVGWPTDVQRSLETVARSAGAEVVPGNAGQAIALAGMTMDTLWPPPVAQPDITQDPNDRALVAHIRHGTFDLLLPADAESGVLARLDLPRVEALKVSHHGSEDAGLPAVLARLQPSVAAIEVGRGNSYGHPAPTTLRALEQVREVVRTDRDGTVRLHVRDGVMRLAR